MNSEPLTLEEIRGADYPPLGTQGMGVNGGKVTDFVYARVQETEMFAQARCQKAARNLLFSDGRQWIDWRKTERAYRDVPVPDGKVRTTANYIRPILRSRQQRILSSNFQWRVEPRSNDYEERDRATVAERLLTSRYAKTDMDGKVRLGLYLSDNCGVSYLKSFWNKSLGPQQVATVTLPHPVTGQLTEYPISAQGDPLADEEGNPLTDGPAYRYRPGDTDTALRTIFNVRLNPDASGIEPDEGFKWLLDMDMRSIQSIKGDWGPVAREVTSQQGNTQLGQYRNLVQSVGPLSFGTASGLDTQRNTTGNTSSDQTLYVEYWEDRSELFPKGRLIVIAGQVLLYDGELPQGRIVHDPIYCERRPFDPCGRPMVDDLIPPQRTINQQISAILTELMGDGLNQWAIFDLPGLSDQITNTDRGILKVPIRGMTTNRGIQDVVMRVPATPLNQSRVAMIELAQRQMFDLGAFHEIQRGQVPPGVDSGIAVQLLMEAENAQLLDTVRQLKLSMIRWGRNQGAIARWGYGDDEERWIPSGTEANDFLVESVAGADLPDFDDLDIDLEGFQPQSTAAYRAEIKEAAMNQWITPNQAMDLMGMGRGLKGAFLTEGHQYAKARRENLAIEREQFFLVPAPELSPLAGGPAFLHMDMSPFLLPTVDDHLRHVEIHGEIALDDTKPWPIRQAILLHIQEHQSMLAQQAAAQMALQTPPGDPNAQ